MAQTRDPEEPPRMDDHPGEGAVRGTQRMEIFADAVFAIAFTLPVLELKLPEPGPGFGERLIQLWPFYLSYVLSALVIGLYWVHHHFSGAIYRTTGHHFLLATMLFLATISSSPSQPAPSPRRSRTRTPGRTRPSSTRSPWRRRRWPG